MVEPHIQKIQNIYSEQDQGNEFSNSDHLISLKELAREYGYTQHHFGLMCRQGKLQATRIGKKWLTTRECVEKYLDDVENKYKSAPIHYSKKPTTPIDHVFPALVASESEIATMEPVEVHRAGTGLGFYFSPRFLVASAFFALFLCAVYFGAQDFFLKREKIKFFVLEKTSGFVLGTGSNFLSFGRNLTRNFIWPVNNFSGDLFSELKNYFSEASDLSLVFYKQISEIDKKDFSLKNTLFISKNIKLKLGGIPYSLLSFSEKFSEFPPHFFSYKVFSNFAVLSNVGENVSVDLFMKKTKNNFLDFIYEAKDLAVGLYDFTKDSVLAFEDWIYDCGREIKLAFQHNKDWASWFKEKVTPRPIPVEKPVDKPDQTKEADEGIVVVPESAVFGGSDVFKRDIKQIFSDEVFITPDNEGDAGIIQPIFKKGKGDEYMYVMVPVETQEPKNE